MTRPMLSLYALDRPALVALTSELKTLLVADDREGIARVLELGAAFAGRLAEGPRAVDWFLRNETDEAAAPLFASLRRVTKKRALTHSWTSTEASLEGRLRQYDVLRAEPEIAKLIDKLLDSTRLPWFMERTGVTSGWLDDEKRSRLVTEMKPLRAALPQPIVDFAEALDEVEGDVVIGEGI